MVQILFFFFFEENVHLAIFAIVPDFFAWPKMEPNPSHRLPEHKDPSAKNAMTTKRRFSFYAAAVLYIFILISTPNSYLFHIICHSVRLSVLAPQLTSFTYAYISSGVHWNGSGGAKFWLIP